MPADVCRITCTGPYTPTAERLIRDALASDVEGLRLVLAPTIADRYDVQVLDDGSEVRLRRRT